MFICTESGNAIFAIVTSPPHPLFSHPLSSSSNSLFFFKKEYSLFIICLARWHHLLQTCFLSYFCHQNDVKNFTKSPNFGMFGFHSWASFLSLKCKRDKVSSTRLTKHFTLQQLYLQISPWDFSPKSPLKKNSSKMRKKSKY